MSELLICTMGLSPGVVTRMTQYLRKEKHPDLAEVWVVFTDNALINDLYNHVLRKEFAQNADFHNITLRRKALEIISDLKTSEEVKDFAQEFSAFLESKMTPNGPVVHVCISGGRKTMTYAAAMAVAKLTTRMGRDAARGKIFVWHVQLAAEEEFARKDVAWLVDQYRKDSLMPHDQDRFLYPENVDIISVPYLAISFVPYAARDRAYSGSSSFSASSGVNRGMGKMPASWRASRQAHTTSSWLGATFCLYQGR